MDISSMLEVEVEEVADSKENVLPRRKVQPHFPCENFSKDENDFYKLTYGSDVASVRFLRLHCTGCDEHIGSAPAEVHNMHEHPVLRTLLCAKCREFYGDGTFEQGDDATDMFCRWCANGGNLYCCSYCSNTFCSKCIKRNFDPPTIKRIEAEDSWKCFVCDPKDLYPLRGIARALSTHIETVTRILENDRRMNSKEIEEKMHLDETKCCSRKRKRRRRRTLSNSEDDEEEDTNYVPEFEREETPPLKRRKIRKDTSRNPYSNGYMDHQYYSNKRWAKIETDVDPSDLLIPCEQTMVEGDGEIINTEHLGNSSYDPPTSIPEPSKSPPIQFIQATNEQNQRRQPEQVLPKISPKNSMSINPVPLANLLKVALSSGLKKIKVTHSPNSKLVKVPLPPGAKVTSFNKPPTHFLLPKSISKSIQQQTKSVPVPAPVPMPVPVQSKQPSVIDLDSDDEPVILENNISAIPEPAKIVSIGTASNENVVPDEIEVVNNIDDYDSTVFHEPAHMAATMTSTRTRTTTNHYEGPRTITIDGSIPLKTQQRGQQFKKMLILQSQEIDSTLNELKTKILKLLQVSNARSQLDGDLLGSAALCTKRFNRALRKTMVELSHINDRVVRDYVHWKKKTSKQQLAVGVLVDGQKNPSHESETQEESAEANSKESKSLEVDEPTLEMICVRESESESEDDDVEILSNEQYSLESVNIPSEFSQILDHLSIFKRKPTGVKAVGNHSVRTEDKACQAYDVSWKDYEKCIGYSLLTRCKIDPETQTEKMESIVMPDENFGKYQEQYLFYLQHIEDYGIETEDLKGSPDPNHIPLKDLIDSTSPFIMDMLERLSPVTLSNNSATSPSKMQVDASSENCSSIPESSLMDTSSSSITLNVEKENENLDSIEKMVTTIEHPGIEEVKDKQTDDNVAPTSKAVEELVKMVTKLSEDLQNSTTEQKQVELDLEKETNDAVNSIIDVVKKSNSEEQQQRVNYDITDDCEIISNDDCTILE